MKYERTVAGLVRFYQDRITEMQDSLNQTKPQEPMRSLTMFMLANLHAHEQLAEWSGMILSVPCPSRETHFVESYIWMTAHRLLRRHAAIFQYHPAYWQGWHPEVDPDAVRALEDEILAGEQ